jgi:hypothetical protein
LGTVSEEIELAAKSTGAVVGALVDDSNALGPAREYANYLSSRVHLRHLPALAERAMATAEKIRASGLPRRAWEELDEPLVTAILEGMAEETDPDLAAEWENLLANTLTDGSANVRRVFPTILRDLEPRDAALLDALATGPPDPRDFPVSDVSGYSGPERATLDNLAGHELVRYTRSTPTTWGTIDDSKSTLTGVQLTELGLQLVEACRAPSKAAQ